MLLTCLQEKRLHERLRLINYCVDDPGLQEKKAIDVQLAENRHVPHLCMHDRFERRKKKTVSMESASWSKKWPLLILRIYLFLYKLDFTRRHKREEGMESPTLEAIKKKKKKR